MDSITFTWKARFLHKASANGMRHNDLNTELARRLAEVATDFAKKHGLSFEEGACVVQREPYPPPPRPSRPKP